MKGYGQFCPVAKAAEIVCERWTPLIVRELICGSRRFSEIQRGVPLMSPSLLSQRLLMLERAGIVEHHGDNRRSSTYELTPAGSELRPLIEGLGVWGQRWVRGQLHEDDLDPGLLMWDIQRRIDMDAFPSCRTCVQFDFAGARRGQGRWWLLGSSEGINLCLTDPGFDVDLYVTTDVRTLTRVWIGDLALTRAIQNAGIELYGPAHLRKAFPRWLRLGVFAGVKPAVRPRQRRGART
jgi:DNA-binding HxlR family transcriptional regulator